MTDGLEQLRSIAKMMGADFSDEEREAKEHQADLEKMYKLSHFQGPYIVHLTKPGAEMNASFLFCELCGSLVYQMYDHVHRRRCEAPED